jgi:transcriptional regulator with XRE-family HTH domain
MELRAGAGLSQRDLAAKIGRDQGMIARIESAQRRVDLVELIAILSALGRNPVHEISLLLKELLEIGALEP